MELSNTLMQVKEFLRKNYSKGCKCPACGQNVKLYKRKLNSGMALFLIGLYRLSEKTNKETHKNQDVMKEMNLNTTSLDYSVLKHFKLIKEDVSEETEKKNSGYWKLTKQGVDFVLNNIQVPQKVHLYNNKVVGYSKEQTKIGQALGSKFNYRELIKSK
jgi:predicted transcriptional regulator